jgi:quinoprotein glucose dehydrogenase
MANRCNISIQRYHPIAFILYATALFLSSSCRDNANDADWPEYLGGPDRNHYSALSQITLDNVNKLKQAWEYHTGDSGQVQCNPIIIDGVVFGMTASSQPFAVDGASGKELWRKNGGDKKWYSTSRGVAIAEVDKQKRLFYTVESDLLALDALTGEPVLSFGDSGKVSLRSGLGESAKEKFVISTTPGTIFEDLIIMPLRISEGSDAAPGYIQAFNTRSGNLEWVFKTIPHPGEEGYETWPEQAYKNIDVGGTNNWAGMAIDRERGILFVPTGSAAFDFYGGNRKGNNLFANTLLALNARTGKKIWHYQFVRHDILDRDLPAPPNLVTVTHNGQKIDAVAQVTKHGFVFLFNRETGEPLFDIKQVPVPPSDIPGEVISPTQPLPVKPLPFARQTLTAADINPDASNRDELITKLNNSRSEGPFTPLSQKGTIIFPGLDGGAEWGGAAVDPEGILYVNSNEMAWLISLEEDDAQNKEFVSPGAEIYASKCASCHGAERKGNPASGFPSLVDVGNKFQRDHVLSVITSGKGMMPAFKSLSANEKKLLIAFLYGDGDVEISGDKQEVLDNKKSIQKKKEVTWKISGYTKFLDSNGNPAITPPWGTLNAIDLNTGEFVWKKIFGAMPNGSESYGGPLITASGLLFIAGTKDELFRAYNKQTGELVWQVKLPAASFATPSTYSINGKQFIVLSCGGTKLGARKGESYVAFTLED